MTFEELSEVLNLKEESEKLDRIVYDSVLAVASRYKQFWDNGESGENKDYSTLNYALVKLFLSQKNSVLRLLNGEPKCDFTETEFASLLRAAYSAE